MRFSLVLQLALLALLLVSATTNAFDSRLSIGTALDTSELTMRTEFPASVGEQLHIFQFPLQIHGRRIEQMKVYSNGFIGIGNHSIELPPNYPSQTAYSQHRLGTLDGDFIGVFTTVNQCSPNGKIIIRDLDLNEVESSTCAWNHVSRIGTVIETSTASALKPFVADYIISITWEGMGCVPSSNPLVSVSSLSYDGATTLSAMSPMLGNRIHI
ncbi:unnamed protein product [Mesocestoides corti]|uniref:Reelin domain-containing protein n=1 Tax=Mesocestoides corti TaxID=53468 RepID=A0A0R3UR09_MESCO|nr:unnamed protein product [Mesocestoides corti]